MQTILTGKRHPFHKTKTMYFIMRNTPISYLVLLPFCLVFLSGCGALGYKAEYSADLSGHDEAKTAKLYYESFNKSVELSAAVSRDLAPACARLAEQVAAPLAPDVAVIPREEMVVSGTGKDFDITKSVPPEPLLPLAAERTRQVQAVAVAIKKTAQMAFMQPAAPPGFVYDQQKSSVDFPALFDLLPESSSPPIPQSSTGQETQPQK